jgi:hypothetical protein
LISLKLIDQHQRNSGIEDEDYDGKQYYVMAFH